MIKKLDHLVITTANFPACIAFYEKLGFRVNCVSDRYELFAGDFKINVHIKGKELMPHAEHVQTGSGDFCFEIDSDLEVFKSDLEKQNLVIELGIVQRNGTNGTMQSVYLRDPDGNLVEFCCYA